MIISIIVAMADNRVIGIDNGLPWYLPADLKHFRAVTMGKPILMGRKTFESIGRPLPGRTNIVISHNPDLALAGCRTATTIEGALAIAGEALRDSGYDEAMVIGGAALYREMLPRTQRLYLTQVHAAPEGDAFFPELDGQWRETGRQDFETDGENEHAYSFVMLERSG